MTFTCQDRQDTDHTFGLVSSSDYTHTPLPLKDQKPRIVESFWLACRDFGNEKGMRHPRIELGATAWKAAILPLNQ